MVKLIQGVSGMLYPASGQRTLRAKYEIQQAERIAELEAEVERLRKACKSALFTIAALESGKLTDFAAHYTMVASTCSSLRAALGLEPKGDGDG